MTYQMATCLLLESILDLNLDLVSDDYNLIASTDIIKQLDNRIISRQNIKNVRSF